MPRLAEYEIPLRRDLRPQDLIERVIGLDEAAALLPAFETDSPAGMTMIGPQRG